ncbi:MAG TPA: ribonuclease PH [Clostridiales bacterium]|nr:ribonuclease PH [Clostridiales bacterium]
MKKSQTQYVRPDGRNADEGRKVMITPHFVGAADGSCLIETGKTRVICTASVERGAPPFLRGTGEGWVTAEYAMLPASTGRRKRRDGLKRDSRGVEISRLIGRALRQAVDRSRLGDVSITIDCDVLEADGGTRTAAITGGFVALVLAIQKIMAEGQLKESPIIRQVAGISAGIVDGQALLDLCYIEDFSAQTDCNVVMDESGKLIEIQGAAEGMPMAVSELQTLLSYAQKGVHHLMEKQREALGEAADLIGQKPTLVIASANQHKVDEIARMAGEKYRVVSMKEMGFVDDIVETGATFEENAVMKAETVCKALGYLTIADDSGLEVDALNGAPGIRSARYAGEHGDDKKNNQKLLADLAQVKEKDRTARFVSAIALASPFQKTRIFSGSCEGLIGFEEKGTGGFGYDPLFIVGDKTFAQLTKQEKDSISHRSRAMAKLKDHLG